MKYTNADPDILVFRAKKTYLILPLISYAFAALPLIALGLSPHHVKIDGWIFCSLLSLGFLAMSTVGVIASIRARATVSGGKLYYHGMWRSRVLDLSKVKYVYVFLGDFVIDVGEKRRVVIPNMFHDRGELLEIIKNKGTNRGSKPVETTGENVNKAGQQAKEARIKEAGGTNVVDKQTGNVVPVVGETEIRRLP